MDIKSAADEIKNNWRQILPAIGVQQARIKVNGDTSYICPFCGHGTHGDGMTFDPNSPGGNSLHCVVCGFYGSVIDLYEKLQAIPDTQDGYVQSVKDLAPFIGISIDGYDRTEGTETAFKGKEAESVQKRTESVTEAHREPQAGRYREDMIKYSSEAGPAAEYMKGRGFTESFINQLIEAHKIGYIPAHKFYDKETGKPVTAEGIVFAYNDDFSYCSMRSLTGKAFDKPTKEEAGEEPVFNAEALYNGLPCFVCESQLDALSVIQAGGNAAAVGGTAYSKLLKQCQDRRPAAPLILFFDNDDKGKAAQDKCALDLQSAGIPFTDAKIDFEAYKEPHKDANDLLRTDPDMLAEDIADNMAAATPKSDIEAFFDEVYTEKYKAVSTGIASLDKLLYGGFIPQTLTLIGAEPGAGKTTIAAMIFENMAEAGHPCIFINLEMSKEQMIARSLAKRVHDKYPTLHLKVIDILRGYTQTPTTESKVREVGAELQESVLNNLKYNPWQTTDVTQILKNLDNEAAAAVSAGRPAPYVCLDYLHLLTGNSGEDAAEILKRAVAGLKAYAIKYNAIVLAIMAESRTAYEGKKSKMSAGRDTSALEYTADLLISLKVDDEAKHDKVHLKVTKSRFSPISTGNGIGFMMKGQYSSLEEIPDEEAEAQAKKDKKAAAARAAAGDKDGPEPAEDPAEFEYFDANGIFKDRL